MFKIKKGNRTKRVIIFFNMLYFFILSLIIHSCSKTPTEPEAKRPQIKVTEDISEDMVWESGKDYIVKIIYYG